MKCMQSISGNTIKIIKMNQWILNHWNKSICYYDSHFSVHLEREKFLGTRIWMFFQLNLLKGCALLYSRHTLTLWKKSYCMLLEKLNYFKNSRDGVRLIKTALICMPTFSKLLPSRDRMKLWTVLWRKKPLTQEHWPLAVYKHWVCFISVFFRISLSVTMGDRKVTAKCE